MGTVCTRKWMFLIHLMLISSLKLFATILLAIKKNNTLLSHDLHYRKLMVETCALNLFNYLFYLGTKIRIDDCQYLYIVYYFCTTFLNIRLLNNIDFSRRY